MAFSKDDTYSQLLLSQTPDKDVRILGNTQSREAARLHRLAMDSNGEMKREYFR